MAAIGIGSDPAITLAPSLSTKFTGDASSAGAIASAFGVGAGLGFLAIPLIRRIIRLNHQGLAGLLLMAGGFSALIVANEFLAALVAFLAAGLGMTLSLTSLSAQLQLRIPDELRGRIMALWGVAFIGSRPLAAAVNGAVADLGSASMALVLVVFTLICAALLLVVRL